MTKSNKELAEQSVQTILQDRIEADDYFRFTAAEDDNIMYGENPYQ